MRPIPDNVAVKSGNIADDCRIGKYYLLPGKRPVIGYE